MNLMFLGAPGAGKGTQAKRLAERLRIEPISTGEMLRGAVAQGTAMGLEAKRYIDAGALVPDQVVIGIVRDRLREPDCGQGYVLDGFPRTRTQAEALAQFATLDAVLKIHLPQSELLQRLAGRRTCRACGAIYHVVHTPPVRAGVCDACGGELYQRSDDNETSVAKRLLEYESKTQALEAYYAGRGSLKVIDGTGSPDEVARRVDDAVDKVTA
jgi:adenylate kinase